MELHAGKASVTDDSVGVDDILIVDEWAGDCRAAMVNKCR